jgi:hypothetical protein
LKDDYRRQLGGEWLVEDDRRQRLAAPPPKVLNTRSRLKRVRLGLLGSGWI